MTKRTRRIIFYISVIVFLGLSYVSVLYAQGYKYSFSEHEFFKTGSIVLEPNVDADIYLSDGFIGSTASFLSNGYAIKRLLPGQYYVRVTRSGYSIWKKNINVEEGLVSAFGNVLILSQKPEDMAKTRLEIGALFVTPTPTPSPKASPTKTPTPTPKPKISVSPTPMPTPTIFPNNEPVILSGSTLLRNVGAEEPVELSAEVKKFYISPDSSKVAWFTITNELWVAWLDRTDYQPYHEPNDTEMIARLEASPDDLRWFDGNDHVVVRFPNKTASPSYNIFEIDTRGGVNVIYI